MLVSLRRAGRAMLTVAALGFAWPTLAQVPAGPQSGPNALRTGAFFKYGPACDRSAVRACQAQASFRMSLCDPYPGRLVCADRILAEQSACFAATGCY
jgi:hypothetical protein